MRTANSLTIVILLVVIGIAVLLVDVMDSVKFGPSGDLNTVANVTCCESGDGDQCQPQTGAGKTLPFNGVTYGLIKANVQFVEGNIHLKDSGQKMGKDPVILNASDTDNNPDKLNTDGYNAYCRQNTTDDTYFKKVPNEQDRQILAGNTINSDTEFKRILETYCTSIPNDDVIFVCKANCRPSACPGPYARDYCYGDSSTQYDVYAKVGAEVPAFIKNCDKSSFGIQDQPSVGPQQLTTPADTDYTAKRNLQLRTFYVKREASINPWFSPFCKPAIYLYPTQKTEVSVKVKPKEPFTLTIPEYPENGWNVTAYPNGDIWSNNTQFKYLYYETKIPDELVSKQKEGYVVEYNKLDELFSTLLPKLGLNNSESSDFASYWKKALPKSPYYLVQVEPRNILDTIAPLTIEPKPNNIIRVTLYFQPLDKKIEINEPKLPTFSRQGFTVVEWGGLFKQDKTHPFTCLM